jgi:peptide/nickel transport system substrate-binding protein
MGMIKRIASVLASVAAILVLLVPVRAAPAASTLTLGVDQEAIGLDPHIVTAFSSFRRIELIYNRLVRFNHQLKLEPDLAESWEMPDELTYVFKLRKAVKFHSGRELTSEDVKFSIERVLDPATRSPARSFVDLVERVEAIDRYTVRIKLQQRYASLLTGLASGGLSIVEKAAVLREGNLQRTEAGTGPFMLKEWVPDNFMRLVRHPQYFRRGNPRVAEVIIKVIPSQATLLAALRTKSVDMAAISDPNVLESAKRTPGVRVLLTAGLNARNIGLNTARPPFNDVRVRQAVAAVLNRQQIIAMAESHLAAVTGPLPVTLRDWALPPAKLPFYTTDLQISRRLLAEAGYPSGLAFGLMTAPSYEGGLSVAQVVQEQLRAAGIEVNLEVVEWGTYVNRWRRRDFDAFVGLKSGFPDPDNFLYRTLQSQSAINVYSFKDAEVDRLLELGRTTTDYKERKAVYDGLQKIIAEKLPLIFLYVPLDKMAISDRVRGFRLIPGGQLTYVEETSLGQ